jgi:hypothetical protein
MTTSRSGTVDVTIRVDKSDADRFDAIVRALEASGLRNLDLHQRFLVINGSMPADRVGELRAIEGVASVREDQHYKAQLSDR